MNVCVWKNCEYYKCMHVWVCACVVYDHYVHIYLANISGSVCSVPWSEPLQQSFHNFAYQDMITEAISLLVLTMCRALSNWLRAAIWGTASKPVHCSMIGWSLKWTSSSMATQSSLTGSVMLPGLVVMEAASLSVSALIEPRDVAGELVINSDLAGGHLAHLELET